MVAHLDTRGSKAALRLLVLLAWAVAFVAAAPGALAAAPYTLQGRCVAVGDGDTITVLDGSNVQHKVRLEGVDAPEKKQPFGQDAKAALSKMVFGKDVSVRVSKREKWGRELGDVTVDKVDVNGSLVRYGHCWVYRAYPHRKELEAYEAEAKAAKRGLWAADVAPIPPWLYRKGVR